RRAGLVEAAVERLLDDAVGGAVDTGGQRGARAFEGEPDGKAARPRALGERVELVDAGLRPARLRAGLLVQEPEEAAQFGQRLAAGVLRGLRPRRGPAGGGGVCSD